MQKIILLIIIVSMNLLFSVQIHAQQKIDSSAVAEIIKKQKKLLLLFNKSNNKRERDSIFQKMSEFDIKKYENIYKECEITRIKFKTNFDKNIFNYIQSKIKLIDNFHQYQLILMKILKENEEEKHILLVHGKDKEIFIFSKK